MNLRRIVGIAGSDSGGTKFNVLLLLLVAVYCYWNYYRPWAHPENHAVPAPAPAPAPAKAPAAPVQEQTYESAQDYVRKNVSFSGVLEGKLDRPGLILRFHNRGDRDINNLSVRVIGYKEFYVPDPAKAEGAEYIVDLEVKSFPAKKEMETVLYFPPGVQSISRGIAVHNGSF